jgi:pepF/M3 family oligoendopeptidase
MNWDLSKLYQGFEDGAFLKDLGSLDGAYASLLAKAEKLDGPANLSALLQEVAEAVTKEIRVALFVQLTLAAEATNESALALVERLMVFDNGRRRVMSAVSNFMKDADVDACAAFDPFLAQHKYLLVLLKREAAHVIDPALEETVLKLRMTGANAFAQLRDQIDAGHMIELDGKKHPLSAIRGMAYSPDAQVRRRAYEAELAAYPAIETGMAACLNAIKGEALTLLPLRRYDDVLDTALDLARIDRATLDALLTAMRESLPAFRRFFRAKAQKLGYEGALKFCDLFAPVGASAKEYSLDEARGLLNEVFSRVSPKMAAFIDRAFEDRWIDAFPRQGKVGGAFCAGAHMLKTSYVLANFDGSLSSVSTLAHELGHAYHNDCVKDLPVLMSDYPMPLAETASIFNETLLVNKLLDAADAETRVTLLDQQLTDAAQVIVDILSRFLFESEVFRRRADHTLTPRELCGIMKDAQAQTYADGLDENFMHTYMWACKSHYYSPDLHFYNFPYAFGLLFGLGVYALYLEKGEAFLPDYDALLHATSAGDVRDVAARVGIDVTDVGFWRGSVKVLTDRIDEFEKA